MIEWILLICCYCAICWLGGLLLERPVVAAVKLVGPGAILKNCTIRLEQAEYAVIIEGSNCAVINSSFEIGKSLHGTAKE